jgi:hypothetical protein
VALLLLFSEEQKTSKTSNNYYLRGKDEVGHPRNGGAGYAGMTCVDKSGKKITAKKQVGQHPGIIELKEFENFEKGVGQHHRNGGST